MTMPLAVPSYRRTQKNLRDLDDDAGRLQPAAAGRRSRSARFRPEIAGRPL